MAVTFSRIVVAFDNSELSKKAVDVAKELISTNPEAELHIISVLETYASSYVEAHYGDILMKAREQTRAELQKLLDEQLSGVTNKAKSVLLEGNPAKKITEYAQEVNADLIVMGSRGLGSIQGIVLGSVSSKVMQLSGCPVLVIK